MSTCTALNGYCANCDYWFHETARIPVAGGELYVCRYLAGPTQLLLQTGSAVRSITAREARQLAGPAAAMLRPLLRLLPAEKAVV